MKTLTAISAVLAYASYTSAHVSLTQPVPLFDQSDNPPDTSPLSPDGSNYPCKASGAFTAKTQNSAAVGSSIQMAFSGSAVHGGGSCQVALTKDGPASLSANSQFKVIYSMLGGCPGVDGSTTTYDVPIPAEVPAGEYVLAWTWFNKIGNREMYMNCAAMTITGGGGSDDTFNSLPDMAVYNVGSKNSCKTSESFDVDFPNPGQYTTRGSGFKPQAPTCDGTSAGTGGGGSGSGNAGTPGSGGSGNAGAPGSGGSGGSGNNGGSPSGGSGNTGGTPASSANNGQYTGIGAGGGSQGGNASPSVSATRSANNGQPTGIGGGSGGSAPQVQAPGAASSAATTATSPSTVQSPAPVSPPSVGGSNGTVGSPSPGAGSGGSSGAACSPDGAMMCSADGSQFALCNQGTALMMAVAPGTRCVNGNIQKKRRDISVKRPFLFKG